MELHRRANGLVAVVSDLAALELIGVTKRFGGVVALHDATVRVRAGTIHALLGENGAGKSTLMRIAYGMTRPDAGEVRIAGATQRFTSPVDAITAGIGMVHQHFTLVPSMTVAENLALGGRGLLNASAMRRQTETLAKRTGFTLDPRARVDTLAVGAQQRVEIAKALARDPSVLILDEPTAVLTPAEVDELLRWLRAFASEGRAVVLITHKLREAMAVSDSVTVMRAGRVVVQAPVTAMTTVQLTSAMLGETLISPSPQADRGVPLGVEVFRAKALEVATDDGRVLIEDAGFAVHAGEIVGIAAVEGSGQHELLSVLAGRHFAARGSLVSPPVVAYIPEDRHRDAVMLDRDLAENVALRDAGRRVGLMDWKQRRVDTLAMLEEFDIRASDTFAPMRSLSGGNQQKLVLARELSANGDAVQAIVADNATRGLDVRAAAAVHARLRDASRRGAAVVMYSNDIDEVLALATRVFVIHNRTLREVPPVRDSVGRAMLGADPTSEDD